VAAGDLSTRAARRGGGTATPRPDPYRDIDAQPDPLRFIEALETRGRTPSQRRLRRRFLRFLPVEPGDDVLEVGCGTGVIVRDLATLVGSRGRVTGVDPSRTVVRAARALARDHPLRGRISLRATDGVRLPFRSRRFDATIAVTVLLHVADPARLLREMARVTRPGGRVGLQDQDFGTVAVEHPDRALTRTILNDVAARIYAEPCSGRRLPRLLREAGLGDVRVLTDVYQDTTLAPYTKGFLERRAENAVRFGIVDAPTAQRWLDGFTALVAQGAFLFTMNYYGAVATTPGAPSR
jgi:ubiquinone/menaquinone biosynthesis C-methylase UbiE